MTQSHALPLYVQISEMLIREINAGRYLDGERLPPERELATQLGIAVGTLRKALADLEAKGLLERRQGSGNYIRYRPDAPSVYSLFRVELVEGAGLPTAELISVDRLAKRSDLPAFGTSSEGHRIRRLRSLGGTPAVLEEIWLDGDLADEVRPEDLSESLYLFYRDALGLWIARAEDRVGLGQVPDWAPGRFGLAPGAACVLVTRVGWDREGRAVEASLSWINSDVARYVARLR